MREIIGQMTIAELVQNRDKFAQESIKAAMSDMSNMGELSFDVHHTNIQIKNICLLNFKIGFIISSWRKS